MGVNICQVVRDSAYPPQMSHFKLFKWGIIGLLLLLPVQLKSAQSKAAAATSLQPKTTVIKP